VTVTVVDGYCARPESLIAMPRRAKSATALRFRTCGRWYLYDAIFDRLAQDLKHKNGAKDLLAASVAAGSDTRDVPPGKAWLTMTHRQVISL
jgi:hypothetical protein